MYNNQILYAGIGSRKGVPDSILQQILDISKEFSKRGYMLRSGGALFSDQFFEIGCNLNQGKKQIFLPWKNYNNNKSPLYAMPDIAMEHAKRFHPKWNMLSDASKKLMARNSQIILGAKLDDPVDFVVCWTSEGKMIGGTAQALRICHSEHIPVFNLGIGLTSKDLYDKIDNLLIFR